MRNCVWTPRLGNDGNNTKNQSFFENLNGRLALEDGSDRRETLGKRVSDDLERFTFRRRKKKLAKKNQKSLQVNFCFEETSVLEELGRFERHWQVGRKKLLPVVNLFLGRLPWRRGKRLNMCRKP